MDLPSLYAVGAAIIKGDLVLCARRPLGGAIGGLWEFPGGKLEPGETELQAVIRECQEELNIIVQPINLIARSTYQYPERVITLATYQCRLVAGEPTALEHDELRWVPISQLHTLDWPPLDLEAVQALQSRTTTRQ